MGYLHEFLTRILADAHVYPARGRSPRLELLAGVACLAAEAYEELRSAFANARASALAEEHTGWLRETPYIG